MDSKGELIVGDLQQEQWISDYYEAYLAANPEKEQPPKIELWSPGWYFFSDTPSTKFRKSDVLAFTERLRLKVEPDAATAPVAPKI